MHGAGAPESTEQAVAEAFAATNENVAVVDDVVDGPTRMFTVGGGVIVHEYDALVESEPDVAVTVNMCAPGVSPLYAEGVEHGEAALPSTEQAIAVAFVAEKEKEAEVDVVVALGPARIATVGAGAGAGGGGGVGEPAVTVQLTSA